MVVESECFQTESIERVTCLETPLSIVSRQYVDGTDLSLVDHLEGEMAIWEHPSRMAHLVVIDLQVQIGLQVILLIIGEEDIQSVLMHFAYVVTLVEIAGEFDLVEIASTVLLSQVVPHDIASE